MRIVVFAFAVCSDLSRGRELMMVFAGTPPFREDELEPLMPSRPNDRLSLWTKLRLVFVALTRAVRLYGCRASVVDARATSVSHDRVK